MIMVILKGSLSEPPQRVFLSGVTLWGIPIGRMQPNPAFTYKGEVVQTIVATSVRVHIQVDFLGHPHLVLLRPAVR